MPTLMDAWDFSPNTPNPIRSSLSGILRMPIVTDPGRYLGLPTIWGQAKKDALGFVKDKILQKVQSWKHQLLSQASWETLIKAVALAVPAYPMNIFLFPNSLCKEINSILANFWWGQKVDERRIHLVSWDSMGQAK